MSNPFLQSARAAMAVLLASLLTACGGGGVVSVAPPTGAVITTNQRVLPAEYLARQAVAYSPFRTGSRDSETITATMVEEDLGLLVQGNFRLIRLFDSSDKVAKLVLDVIADNGLDVKVQLGAYVNTFKYVANPYTVEDIKAGNQRELDRAVALATDPKYRDIILAVSVGNETMVNWSVVPIDPADMAGYIKNVRDRVTQPVTTDDNFLFFTNPIPKVITDQIDFAAIHTYPNIDTQFPQSDLYWDWKQLGVSAGPARAQAMMDASIVETRRQYQLVRDSLDSMGLNAMPIAVTETGWNAVDKGAQRFRAHPVNQKMYFERLDTWRVEGRVGPGPANIFYFEAFDEPWKQGDDGWGLFNVQRKARYVIQNLYPQTLWESTALTEADALYFLPPTINAPFTGTQYALNSDAPGAVLAAGLRVDAFDGDSVAAPEVTTATPPEGVKSIEITPQPKSYGWGLLWQPQTAGTTQNLSQFADTGRIHLWVKSGYPGKIEIGLSTLTSDGDTQEVFLQIGAGEYGYCNTGTWCEVSIPLQAFKTKNPKIDFQLVVSPFLISDVYSRTGNTAGSTQKINIDGIYWAR